MTNSVGTVSVDVRTNTAKFNQGMEQAGKRLGQFGDAAKKITGIVSGLAAVAGTISFAAMISQSRDVADALGKASDKILVQTERLAALHLATKLYTTQGVGAMNEALTKATKRLGEFNATGGGAAAKWLEELNLNTQKLADLRADELFRVYAEAIRGLSDRGQQLAAVSALMGDESRNLIGIIDAGTPAIDKAADASRRLGTALSREQAAEIEAVNDSMTLLGESFVGVGNSLNLYFGPALSEVSEWLAFKIPESVNYGLSALDKIAKGIIESSIWVVGKLKEFSREMSSLPGFLGGEAFKKDFEILSNLEFKLRTGYSLAKANKKAFEEFGAAAAGANKSLSDFQGFTGGGGNKSDSGKANVDGIGKAALIERPSLDIDHDAQVAAYDDRMDMLYEHNLRVRDTMAEHNRLVAADEARIQTERLEGLQWVTDQMLSLEQQRTQGALYLMQALGQKSKTFAIAAFAAEKLIAVKRIIVQTQVAAAAALTPPPIGLGPVAGAGLAASIRANGAASAIFTGAASVVEGLNRFGGGGGSISTPAASIGGGASGGAIGDDFTPGSSSPYQESTTIHVHLDIGGRTAEEIVVSGFPAAVSKDRIVIQGADGKTYTDTRVF